MDALAFLIEWIDGRFPLLDVLAAACNANQIEVTKSLLPAVVAQSRRIKGHQEAEGAFMKHMSEVISQAILHGPTASTLVLLEETELWSAKQIAPLVSRTQIQPTVKALVEQLKPDRLFQSRGLPLSYGLSH
jgi:hypothetical protein